MLLIYPSCWEEKVKKNPKNKLWHKICKQYKMADRNGVRNFRCKFTTPINANEQFSSAA